ncbi:MAG: PhoPQ-activated protein PqaA family protein [Planctomycetota bacterium]
MEKKQWQSWLVSIIVTCFFITSSSSGTALDDYVFTPDANYSYVQIGSDSFDFSTFTRGYVLELTSQGWRDSSEVDRVLWKHWVTIVIPEWDFLLGETKDTALILINDGNSFDPAPDIDPQFRTLAAGTRSVVVEISAIPNQPLQFSDEIGTRSEDEIIAYSWDKFLHGADAYWPVQLPMVKAVVRCMDAAQEFVGTSVVDTKTINNFVLTGGSKRGWTAWLTAAVDSRVTAVAPIVSDLLNMKRSFAHHWGAYGFWADALVPYEEMGIFDFFDTPESTALMEIVDPYEYRDRLNIPKFIINAAGDDFFVLDSVQFYIDELIDETYLRHVPNTDHYLTEAFLDVFNSMVPYYYAFLNNQPRPDFSSSLQEDGSIMVDTNDTPKEVYLWQVDNPNDRDFRQLTVGPNWVGTPLADQGGGVYIGEVNEPAQGWTAFFVELIYDNEFSQQYSEANEYDYRFTSRMRVLPEILPFEVDFDRDRETDANDLEILSDYWLSDNTFRDIAPRLGGDGIVNFKDYSLLALHFGEGH